MLNSIGLQNPGVEHLKADEVPWLAGIGATIIVNVSGHSFDEYVRVIEALEESPVDAYEVNISCPNVDAGGMTMGCHAPSVEKVVGMCREATKRPLIVKLTPNVTDITEIARAAEAAGADALSLINTLLGMAIDARRRSLNSRAWSAVSRGLRSSPSRCAWCGSATRRSISPFSAWAAFPTARTRLSSCSPEPPPSRSAQRTSSTPATTIDVIDGIVSYWEEQGVKHVSELIGALEC